MIPQRFPRLVVMGVLLLFVVACTGKGEAVSPTPSSPSASPSASPSGVSTSAATYAKGLCGAERKLIDSLEGQTTRMSESVAAMGDSPLPPAVYNSKLKKMMIAYFAGIVTVTNQLISRVQALGVPGVEGGLVVQAQIIYVFTKMRTLFVESHARMELLPTNDLAVLDKAYNGYNGVKGARHLAAQHLQAVASGMTNALLRDAFKAELSCTSFGGAGGRPPVVIVWG